jgi:hypothetical protein
MTTYEANNLNQHYTGDRYNEALSTLQNSHK